MCMSSSLCALHTPKHMHWLNRIESTNPNPQVLKQTNWHIINTKKLKALTDTNYWLTQINSTNQTLEVLKHTNWLDWIDSTNTNLQVHCYHFVAISRPAVAQTYILKHTNWHITNAINLKALTDNTVKLCEECNVIAG